MKRTILTLTVALLFFLEVKAQKEKIQAAYIYQFTKLIEWCPSYKSGDFVIGVLGNSAIVGELSALKGKTVASQTIVIKTYSQVSEIDKCNILFLPSVKSDQLASVNVKIANNCTLVVTEKSGMAKEGSSINFIEEGGKVLFEINKAALSKHSLPASAKLITLAKVVY